MAAAPWARRWRPRGRRLADSGQGPGAGVCAPAAGGQGLAGRWDINPAPVPAGPRASWPGRSDHLTTNRGIMKKQSDQSSKGSSNETAAARRRRLAVEAQKPGDMLGSARGPRPTFPLSVLSGGAQRPQC
jgi:hypothetical protein